MKLRLRRPQGQHVGPSAPRSLLLGVLGERSSSSGSHRRQRSAGTYATPGRALIIGNALRVSDRDTTSFLSPTLQSSAAPCASWGRYAPFEVPVPACQGRPSWSTRSASRSDHEPASPVARHHGAGGATQGTDRGAARPTIGNIFRQIQPCSLDVDKLSVTSANAGRPRPRLQISNRSAHLLATTRGARSSP